MAQIKKTKFASGLDTIPVLIEDTSTDSAYFNLNNFPTLLHSGKNYFLIAGSNLLKQGSSVDVEVLDSTGQPIYTEIADILVAGTFRLVSIYVYSDTPIGFANVIIVGEAREQNLMTPSPQARLIPTKWQGKFNVRWQKKVKVDTLKGDDTPAILKNLPKINMTEIYDEFRNLDDVYVPVSMSFNNTQGAVGASFGNTAPNSPYYYLKLGAWCPATFSNDMVGAIVHFPNPTSFLTTFGVKLPFTTQITRVINMWTATVSPSYLIPPGQQARLGIPAGYPQVQKLFQPIDFTAISEFTMSYVSKSMNVGSINKKLSYINVKVTDLDTYVGVLKYIDIYRQPGNLYMGRWPIVPNEKLTAGYNFTNLSDFTNNWNVNGKNQWYVQLVSSSIVGSYEPTPTTWLSSSLSSSFLYSKVMDDVGQNTPYTNSLTLYNSSPTVDFFGIGTNTYKTSSAKLTTYVYATQDTIFSGTASVDDGASIYIDNLKVFSTSSAGFLPYSMNFTSGSHQVDIYLQNGILEMFMVLSNSLSLTPNIRMNAYSIPPNIDWDNTKLMNAIKIEQVI